MDKKTYNKLYMRRYRDKLKKEKKCLVCYKPLENNYRKHCDSCLSKASKRNIAWWQKHRTSELERGRTRHYSYKVKAMQLISKKKKPCCVKCGFDDMRALTINHVNGDGYRDLSRKAGMYILVALKKRKTNDLEVMCCNCNKLYEYECGRHKLPIHMREE